jgi:hypothetical protein
MSTMALKVDISAGTTIDRAAACTVRLANELDLCVDLDFNGVPLFAFPGDDPLVVATRYHDKLTAMAHMGGHAAPNPPVRRRRRAWKRCMCGRLCNWRWDWCAMCGRSLAGITASSTKGSE